MAGEILDKITPQGDPNAPTAEDISQYTPSDMTPEQVQAFQESQQPAPTGALNAHDYYPDINHQIGVGHYGGDQIGSTTLFAPGGGLVPLGMMDERDAAAHRAALNKAKQLEDFNKKYQAPTTKHVAVQQEMTKQYIDQLNQWKVNALKKAGGDHSLANKMLESDPTFNKWNKNWQDTKNLHDSLVGHAAELEASEKDPNFVLSPQTRKAKQDMMSGLAYQEQNPFDTKGHNTSLEFLRSRANYDLDKASNVAIEKAIPDIEQLPPEYKQRGKNEVMTLLEKEYFKPERVEEIANNLYREKYYGTDISKEQVKDRVQSLLGEKLKRHVEHYDKWFKPDADSGKQEDYTNAAPKTTSTFNVASPTTKVVNGKTVKSEGISEIHMDNFYNTTASDEQKKINISLSKSDIDTQGKDSHLKAGQVEGTVAGAGTGYYDKVHKRMLQPDEVKLLKEGKYGTANDVEARAAVMFTPEKEAGDKGPKQGIIIEADKVKGKFPNKGTKKGFDHVLDKVMEDATAANSHRKGTGWPVINQGHADNGTGTHYIIGGKQHTQEAVDKAAKASGMTRDEYLAAINQK